MKTKAFPASLFLLVWSFCNATAAVLYVDANSANPMAPYADWSTAAATIQDAVDAATTGDEILVTNGVYNVGGRFDVGLDWWFLPSRVTVDRPVSIQGVNGPEVTFIEGAPGPGESAIRCIYLGAGSSLTGFTLTNGSTRGDSPWYEPFNDLSGPAAFCEVGAVISNCVITGNSAYGPAGGVDYGTIINSVISNNVAYDTGGAAYGSTLINCLVSGNQANNGGGGTVECILQNCVLSNNSTGGGNGGGALSCTLSNCTLTANSAPDGGAAAWSQLDNCKVTDNIAGSDQGGGGTFQSTLTTCALVNNRSGSYGGGDFGSILNHCTLSGNTAALDGGGSCQSTLANCIVYYNSAQRGANYSAGSLQYCCATPLPGGVGNIAGLPGLVDGFHLSGGSPCLGAAGPGNITAGDIDGEPWNASPAIGCDEYQAETAAGPLSVTIQANYTNVAAGFGISFLSDIRGSISSNTWDFDDGMTLTNQSGATHAWAAPGDYLVAFTVYNDSNPDGVAASMMIHIGNATNYVAQGNSNPVAPYISWATAATNIQDAIDQAALGATVLVSNGVYQTGGRPVGNPPDFGPTLTNRVAVTNPLTVASVNGPAVTSIVGYQVPGTTNDAGAVRCVYLAAGANLNGFTITNGATGPGGSDGIWESWGGGVDCASDDAVVSNCVIVNNAAGDDGGGANGGTYYDCQFFGNQSPYGGGAEGAVLNGCVFSLNTASIYGGGVDYSTINNCTIAGNTAGSAGGASYSAVNNSIIYYNNAPDGNTAGSTLNYCCTIPLPDGSAGCITNAPQLADFAHLSAGSPCCQAGNPAYATGTDIDGEAWLNPPSIGCDEYHAGAITGPLVLTVSAAYTNVIAGFTVNFTGSISGHASANSWGFGDGTVASNLAYISHSWQTVGDYAVVFRAYNEDFPDGVALAQVVHVVPGIYYVAQGNPSPVAPYTSWTTAATNIQDAADVAAAGGTIVVSNGVYTAGGRVVNGAMSNRVALCRPTILQSVNGPLVTTIMGAADPATTNGDEAVRCVYLGENTSLTGFTLTNGATRNLGDGATEQCGGGVFCTSTGPVVANCVLAGNAAANVGGGAYQGTLNDCMVTGNEAVSGGGGTCLSTMNNCTVSGNTAPLGAGVYQGTLNNCASYYNNGDNYAADPWDSVTLNYSCTTPDPGGMGNITNAPAFVNPAGGDFRLQSGSPCINSGNNAYVADATDLDGNPRIVGGTVDIGAEEYQSPSSKISYAWLQRYGLATDGSADFVDFDGDGMSNWQEWVAGTNPTDASSFLQMIAISGDPASGVTVTWTSASGVNYYLQSSPNLSAQPAFTTIQTGIAGQDGSTSWTDTTATNGGPYFYRVGVQR